ncbi:Transmembrane domain-containing protein [Spironucleus salmonicida]|uniref:Transmembrane domain-containing protein n=2 Tax=Spironucleus TaxID=39709 RepID=V6LHU5_9EUKA|nr:hypothetical protein [Spironucleus barkhanus]KAH0577742.1 Transmembrane domain-containing protein [Spironucleus salmonicida]|eukprot:EST43878.1 Transmembrane domain-containing protein [Spironucleus salmonicida]
MEQSEGPQLSLAEQKAMRQKRILEKQKQRMALVMNSTTENVEMPEEFDRFEKQKQQQGNPNVNVPNLGQLGQIPGLNQFMQPLQKPYSKSRKMLFNIYISMTTALTFFYSKQNCYNIIGLIQTFIQQFFIVRISSSFNIFLLQSSAICILDYQFYKLNPQIQTAIHLAKQFFKHLLMYFIMSILFSFMCQ